MGRYKSLGSLKSFLWYAPQLFGACLRYSHTLSFLRAQPREGLPWWLRQKESARSAGDPIQSLNREDTLEKGKTYTLQYSCLENPMDKAFILAPLDCHKIPQTRWFKAIGIYSLKALEAGSLKSRCQQGCIPLKSLKKDPSLLRPNITINTWCPCRVTPLLTSIIMKEAACLAPSDGVPFLCVCPNVLFLTRTPAIVLSPP